METCRRFLFLRSGNSLGTNPRIDAIWANTRSTSSYVNAYAYTGRQLDAETGLYYYRARMYSAQLGRFASRDPIAHEMSGGFYRYANDSPICRTDSSGYIAEVTAPTAGVDDAGNACPENEMCRICIDVWTEDGYGQQIGNIGEKIWDNIRNGRPWNEGLPKFRTGHTGLRMFCGDGRPGQGDPFFMRGIYPPYYYLPGQPHPGLREVPCNLIDERDPRLGGTAVPPTHFRCWKLCRRQWEKIYWEVAYVEEDLRLGRCDTRYCVTDGEYGNNLINCTTWPQEMCYKAGIDVGGNGRPIPSPNDLARICEKWPAGEPMPSPDPDKWPEVLLPGPVPPR